MKKLMILATLLIAFCAPVHAVRLKSQAQQLELGVKTLAKSHNRLWRLASTLQARIQQLENSLRRQNPAVSLVKGK